MNTTQQQSQREKAGMNNRPICKCRITQHADSRHNAGIRRIEYCSLHATAFELFMACQKAIVTLQDWTASEEEREYDVTPEGLRSLAQDLEKVVSCAIEEEKI